MKSPTLGQKTKISLGVALGLLTPVGAYHKAMSDMRVEIVNVRLERERDFVKKDDLQKLIEKVDKVAEDVAVMRGYLEGPRRGR